MMMIPQRAFITSYKLHIADDRSLRRCLTIQMQVRRELQCDATMLTNVAAPTVSCCDICSPSLLDLVRPGKKPNTDRSTRLAFEKQENQALYKTIDNWREETYERNYKDTSLQAENVLPNEAISRLAHLKLPVTAAAIRSFLVDSWPFWDQHGEDLMERVLIAPTAQPTPSDVMGDGEVSTPTHQQDSDPTPSRSDTLPRASPCSVPLPQPCVVPPSTPTRQPDPAALMSPYTPHPLPLTAAQQQVPFPLRVPGPPNLPVYNPPFRQDQLGHQAPLPSNMPAPFFPVHNMPFPPPTSFSPVVMYHHPSLAHPPLGLTTFGGSFSYQDLANMANASLQNQPLSGMFTQQAAAKPPPAATSFIHHPQGSPP